MRKIVILCLGWVIVSCSFDQPDELKTDLVQLDAIVDYEDCEVYHFQLEDKGALRVQAFHDYIEVQLTATGSAPVNQISLHFVDNSGQFPTNGRKLNTSLMYYSEKLAKDTYYLEKNFTFSELGLLTGDKTLVAAVAEFGKGKNKKEIYAGDISGVNGEWSYFELMLNPFKNYAGTDQIREMPISEAQALPSWDEVRKVYANMLDPGVPKKSGTYNPSIWDIINDFNDPNRESKLDDYTTTYTLGEGECADSVELTLRVIAD